MDNMFRVRISGKSGLLCQSFQSFYADKGGQKQVLSVNLTTYSMFAMLCYAMLNASGGPRMHRFTNNKTTTEQKITATASGWWWFSSFRRVVVTFGRCCFVCTSLAHV